MVNYPYYPQPMHQQGYITSQTPATYQHAPMQAAPYQYQPPQQRQPNTLLRNENFKSYCKQRKRSSHKREQRLDESFYNSVQL